MNKNKSENDHKNSNILSSLNLPPRLQAIADMVPENTARVADIGTDHAYLPIWLLLNGKARKAAASDLRSGPVARAKANIKKYGLEDTISVCLGDGLEKIKLKADDLIIIAGMGGMEIIRILQRPLPPDIRLILQPQRSIPELRFWLAKNNFEIADENIVVDRAHCYTIIETVYKNFSTVENLNSVNDYYKHCGEKELVNLWLGSVILAKYSNHSDSDWDFYLAEMKAGLEKICIGKPELKAVLSAVNAELAKKGD